MAFKPRYSVEEALEKIFADKDSEDESSEISSEDESNDGDTDR